MRTTKSPPADLADTATIHRNSLARIIEILSNGWGLILCGPMDPQEQQQMDQLVPALAQRLNCPVLIDPLSQLRFNEYADEHYIYHYDQLLRSHQARADIVPPRWIIHFGRFPISKALLLYVQGASDCHSILISSYGDRHLPVQDSKPPSLVHSTPQTFCHSILEHALSKPDNDYLRQWQQWDSSAEAAVLASLSSCSELFEAHVIQAILQHLPANSLIFSGNSMAIRDFDSYSSRSLCTKRLALFANRGVSGIDGNLSTFLGLLSAQSHYGLAVLGDLSFYHDMNALILCRQLAQQGHCATIMLLNNNGGGIFNYLPQRQLASFSQLWNTPTHLDFQYAAKLYGLGYHRIDNKQQLDHSLPQLFKASGIQLVELIIDQQTSVECHQNLYSNQSV